MARRVQMIMAVTLTIAVSIVAAGRLTQSQHKPRAQAHVKAIRAKFPISFEPNVGQADSRVRFVARAPGSTLYFAPSEVVLAFTGAGATGTDRIGAPPENAVMEGHASTAPPAVARLQFLGANPAVGISGAERASGKVNYLIGNDPRRWRTNLATYSRVFYGGLYPGVKLSYDGSGGQLKGTYVVAAGADPSQIRWRYDGAKRVGMDDAGNLRVSLRSGGGKTATELVEKAPVAWQEIGGKRVPVSAGYALTGDGHIGFLLGEYDRAHALTLDPVLTYSTYLGAPTGTDIPSGIAVDRDGNAYVTGRTVSTSFPTHNPYQSAHAGGFYDAFVTKINAAGSALVYSTYLGGTGADSANGIAVDGAGNAYVSGSTNSSDFPTTAGAVQPASAGGGSEAFVTKLNAAGSALVYATYLGGSISDGSGRDSNASDSGYSIAVDAAFNAYVTGFTNSTDFPTVNPFRAYSGNYDAFIAKINAAGSALMYSSYLGGSGGGDIERGFDYGFGIAVDGGGNAYLCGVTASNDFPTASAIQPAHAGGTVDLFVSKINAAGSALVYSTYLGGTGNETCLGRTIAVDLVGNAYIAGRVTSTDFPTAGPLQPAHAGVEDAFVAKLGPTGSTLVYSTYLGGSAQDVGFGIAIDGANNAYVTGGTISTDFPTRNPIQAIGGGQLRVFDAFVAKLNADGASLSYSTYLGGTGNDLGHGLAVDGTGNAYITGETQSKDFPTVNPIQPVPPILNPDVFITKISDSTTAVTLTSFRARVGRDAIAISWRTASETQVAAFDLWRFGAHSTVKVNPRPIPAKARGRARGGTYRVVDRNVRAGSTYTYRLRILEVDGTGIWGAATTARVKEAASSPRGGRGRSAAEPRRTSRR